jgi:hypothetical protein
MTDEGAKLALSVTRSIYAATLVLVANRVLQNYGEIICYAE